MSETAPFAGEYPTRDEIEGVLKDFGFEQHIETEVTSPFDQTTGSLADKLIECRSAHLATQWPDMFKAVVGQIIKQAN